MAATRALRFACRHAAQHERPGATPAAYHFPHQAGHHQRGRGSPLSSTCRSAGRWPSRPCLATGRLRQHREFREAPARTRPMIRERSDCAPEPTATSGRRPLTGRRSRESGAQRCTPTRPGARPHPARAGPPNVPRAPDGAGLRAVGPHPISISSPSCPPCGSPGLGVGNPVRAARLARTPTGRASPPSSRDCRP